MVFVQPIFYIDIMFDNVIVAKVLYLPDNKDFL